MSEEKYISTTAAAIMLGVTPKTIQNWIRSGHLIAHQPGPAKNSPFMVLRSSVEEKLPENEAQVNQ